MIDRISSAIAAACLSIGGGLLSGGIIGSVSYSDGEAFISVMLGLASCLGVALCVVGTLFHHHSLPRRDMLS
jgi:hypothetical protein